MLLCVDIGNTNIKLGLYEGEKLVTHWRIYTNESKLADEYAVLLLSLFESENIRKEEIDGCAISSVVPELTIAFKELVNRHLNLAPVIVGNVRRPVIHINASNPKEVGPDLIANAVGAVALYGAPCIIIGFGTATTFSAVSAKGEFEGVAIAPGILTAAASLFQAGAMLPAVDLHKPEKVIGKNTILSLQSGLIYGFAGLVEGLVARIQKELGGNAKVVATGGLASLIADEVTCIDAIEPELTLLGVRLIYEKNK
ncbi:MAG TPA: type III pantothenate kinase [Anaerolineaceae bacterium]|jgi:type III pantothenate kinase|nr:type III pantothenate kinase [Anaerolineaceae bacterium]HOV06527.1 type III pantothenate kinase [Anaerolineaceae bacterium]